MSPTEHPDTRSGHTVPAAGHGPDAAYPAAEGVPQPSAEADLPAQPAAGAAGPLPRPPRPSAAGRRRSLGRTGTVRLAAPERPVRRRWSLGLLRNEITTTFRRRRTLVLLAVLAAVPVLVGTAVRVETGGRARGGGGAGPAFFGEIAGNGLFLVFASLAATLPVFLPLAVAVVAGDSVAGEAGTGTLRYLLVAPAGRVRLLAVKYLTSLAFCLAATVVVAVVALAVGALLFPTGPTTLLSGTTVSFGAGLLRAAAVAGVVAASLVGVAALGLFVSTLTSSGVAAMATTVGLVITVQILDTVPQLHAVQPYFFPHYWLSFADLLRAPVYWDDLYRNLGLQAVYAGVFASAAWAHFTGRDVTD
ncbi:ABC transporter permease [Streptomyces sp. NPDC059740]|uniref:ABC transporter permease n=1 Tax=Streptomyces sp. NPDC059740 TaxID=3346926 RepID=UPI003664BF41